MEKVIGIARIARWATQMFHKKADAPIIIAPSVVVYQDELRVLSSCLSFDASRANGQAVRIKTQAMSSHSMSFRSDRELNLGEMISLKVAGMQIAATVVHVHPTKRTYGGELELSPTPTQRAALLELLPASQVVNVSPTSGSPVLSRPVVRKVGPERSRSLLSGTRSLRSRQAP